MESVVPELSLTPEIGGLVWLAADEDDTAVASGDGEWVRCLGFGMRYRGDDLGAFAHGTAGSDRERLLSVALQLMSDVQDVVSETTTEPWPLIVVNGRTDMAMPDAAVEEDDLVMWFGDRSGPALRLPPVSLV